MKPSHLRAFEQLQTLFQQGAWEQVEQMAGRLILDAPYFALAWNLLGALYLQTGRIESALRPLERARNLEPDNPHILCNLGLVYAQSQEPCTAENCYRAALAAEPGHLLTLNNLATLLTAQQRHAEAIELLQRAIMLAPSHVDAYNNLGVALREVGQPLVALTYLIAATRLASSSATVWYNLALAQEEAGYGSSALSSYRHALELDPHHRQAAINLIRLLTQEGAPASAIQHAANTLGIAPADQSLWINLGHALLSSGQPRLAKLTALKAVLLTGNSPVGMLEAGESVAIDHQGGAAIPPPAGTANIQLPPSGASSNPVIWSNLLMTSHYLDGEQEEGPVLPPLELMSSGVNQLVVKLEELAHETSLLEPLLSPRHFGQYVMGLAQTCLACANQYAVDPATTTPITPVPGT